MFTDTKSPTPTRVPRVYRMKAPGHSWHKKLRVQFRWPTVRLRWPKIRRPRCPKVVLAVWRALGQDKRWTEKNLILAPGERVLFSAGYHPFWALRDYTSWTNLSRVAVAIPIAWVFDKIVGWVLSGGLWWMTVILWILFVIHAAMFIYKILLWRANRLFVTTLKPIWVSGVLHRTTKPIDIRGADVEAHRSIPGRIFRYGELKIDHLFFRVNPDIHKEAFMYLLQPKRVEQAIVLQQGCDLSFDPTTGARHVTLKRRKHVKRNHLPHPEAVS